MRELGVAVCSHIFHGTRPVLLDEDWSLIGVNHLTDRDPTLGEMRVPEAGFQAERATTAALPLLTGASWSVRPIVWE